MNYRTRGMVLMLTLLTALLGRMDHSHAQVKPRGQHAPIGRTAGRAPELYVGDRLVLERLKKAGSNLTKSHTIDFFLYLPSQRAARRVAAEMRAAGFTVHVDRSPTKTDRYQWTCELHKTMIPTEANVAASRVQMNSVAQRYHGEYDGWGTEVVK